MQIVLLTGIGVGGATLIGAATGFSVSGISGKWNNTILSAAAGVMLAVAVEGLILPSFDHGGNMAVIMAVSGVFCGGWCLNLAGKVLPCLRCMTCGDKLPGEEQSTELDRVLLFLLAVAVHNLPEGIAAGVSFGAGDTVAAMAIAGGIALHNIPEGMITIGMMLTAGMSRTRALAAALITGAAEVLGTLLGYLAVGISTAVLPFMLAFAGGTLLYVISGEMIPQTHAHGKERGATYALLAGFCLMLVMSHYLE